MAKDYTGQKFLRGAKSGVPSWICTSFGGMKCSILHCCPGQKKNPWMPHGETMIFAINRPIILCSVSKNIYKDGASLLVLKCREEMAENFSTVILAIVMDSAVSWTGRNEEEWLEHLNPGMRKALLYGHCKSKRNGL